jgi:hypothetical protein
MARSSILLALALLGASQSLAAQAPAPSGGLDSFLLLVAPRDPITIKRQFRAATDEVAQAESRRQQAETMRLGARGRIEAKKVEIVRIKERISLAKRKTAKPTG